MIEEELKNNDISEELNNNDISEENVIEELNNNDVSEENVIEELDEIILKSDEKMNDPLNEELNEILNNQLNKKLIKNNYFIVDNHFKDEFHIAIYYITNNKCKIIIRRLDCVDWGQDLKIMIMDLDNKNFEKISLGSSYENLKIIEFYTKIILNPIDNNIIQNIPKIIIQTSNYDMNINLFHYNSILSFIELNPDYEYKYFNDNDCRKFIIDHPLIEFNEIDYNRGLKAFDLLLPGPLKADLFRYYYLYIKGGCYFDCKMVINKPLNKIIEPNNNIILCEDEDKLYNGLILIEAKNKIMYNCLSECINNILNKNKLDNPYKITGKELFYKHFNSNNISLQGGGGEMNIKFLKKEGDNIFFKNNVKTINNRLFKYSYKDYYTNYFNTERDIKYMWKENKYFFHENNFISNFNDKELFKYKFYIYPSHPNFIGLYNIIHIKKNIFLIERLGEKKVEYIKLKIIDLHKNNVYIVEIGNVDKNKIFFMI